MFRGKETVSELGKPYPTVWMESVGCKVKFNQWIEMGVCKSGSGAQETGHHWS